MAYVNIDNLQVAYGTRQEMFFAVDKVSMQVEKQQSIGIVGESGSGKSTILRALCGLAPIYGGSAEIEGESAIDCKMIVRAKKMQMIFQDPYGSIHPKKTISEILSEPLKIHKFDNIAIKIKKTLEQVGIPQNFLYRYPHQLSGGQRQRIVIARAIILEPELLLLDEPTSALDVSIQSEILNLLTDLRQQRNLTYIMVSHNLAVVAHMCESIAIMQYGKVVETADKKDLIWGNLKQQYSQKLWSAAAI